MTFSTRKANFAGQFYPETQEELGQLLHFIEKVEFNKINPLLADKLILGAIVPHAGYIYSGYHAVHVYELIKRNAQQFDTFVIINPNHSGKGHGDFNLSSAEQWETPLGSIAQDQAFLNELNYEYFDLAHENEHSGEVQLPFLQYFVAYPFKIAMITMNNQTPENALSLAQNLHRTAQKLDRKIMVIASSDFSHFEKVDVGFKKDQYLIEQILNLDTSECYKNVKKHHISACGYGPIMTLIEYAKLQSNAPKMELLRRGNSGETNLTKKVVNYASFLCFE
ncbi:MAG: AmmeMemoRadiSam system protein B [Prolixibacteraceae bacterium]